MDLKAKPLLSETKYKFHVPEHDKYFSGVRHVSVGSGACSIRRNHDNESDNLRTGACVAQEHVTGLCWNACYIMLLGIGNCIPKRYWVTFLAFFGFFFTYYARINLSIAFIEMTSSHNVTVGNETVLVEPEFHWSSMETGLIFSAFSIGHAFSFFGGLVVLKLGSVNTLGIGIGLVAILSILFPFFLRVHLLMFVCGRMLQGLFQGFAMCSAVDIFTHWSPPTERTLLISIALSGCVCSVTINYPISGYVAYYFGWPAIFYTSGVVTLIWCCAWLFFVGADPSKDKFISEKERSYLKNDLNSVVHEKVDIPWKDILSSKPVYALFNECFVFAWTASFVHYYLPLYIHDVHHLDIEKVGLISGIPALCAVITQPISAYIADYLRSNVFSISKVHRIFILVGEVLTLASLLAAVLCNSVTVSFICICFMRIAVGISQTSYEVICIDIAGRYASVLKAICVTTYSLGDFISPWVLGYLIKNHTIFEWHLYFIVICVITMWSVAVFFSIGSGELQPWAILEHEKRMKSIPQNPREEVNESNSILRFQFRR